MGLEADAIEKIESLVNEGQRPVEIEGKMWAQGEFKRIIHDPQPNALRISSLKAIVDFVEKLEQTERAKFMVVVTACDNVILVDKDLTPETMNRKTYLSVNCSTRGKFPFGDWQDIETFLIKVRALFKETPSRKALLEFTARITTGSTVELKDDGVSQAVTVKAGVSGSLKDNEIAPAIVTLQPYRTFRELEQPASEFSFRIRSQGDKVVCALFEADGGAWENAAIKSIDEWLTPKLVGVTILA